MSKFLIHIHSGPELKNKATLGMLVAITAFKKGDEVNMFLAADGTHLLNIKSVGYKLYDKEMPEGIMPMSIHKLGNSSVATVPTLYDLILNDQIENHEINPGDIIMLASVGAGMNINAIVYKQ